MIIIRFVEYTQSSSFYVSEVQEKNWISGARPDRKC